MTKVDLDSTPIRRRSPRATTRRAKNKSRIRPRLFASSAKLRGIMLDLAPLKKKAISDKQQGKRPKVQSHAQPQVEERPLPKKTEVNASCVEKSSEKNVKSRGCYLCREKGHVASSCTSGNLSKPIIIDDIYSLGKAKVGNVFAKFVGTQSGVKKRTIWVAKPIVTNLLGPNLVGDQLAQT